MQINLFKNVEEMIKVFHFFALRWNWLERCLCKRFKQTYIVKCDCRYTKAAFLWGDGIKDIIQQCQKEKKVYIYIQLYIPLCIPASFSLKCRSQYLMTLMTFCRRYRCTCRVTKNSHESKLVWSWNKRTIKADSVCGM